MFFPNLEYLWHPLLFLGLILGVGVGAVLYAGISNYLNRKPVIGRRVDILPKFEDLYGLSLQPTLTLSVGDKVYPYSHLHLVQIEASNLSKQDFAVFELGVTLSSKNTVIYAEMQPIDRYHIAKQVPPSLFEHPCSHIDLVLQPFHREDVYKFRLIVYTTEICDRPGAVTLSSPASIRFVDMPTTQETVEKAAKAISLPLGPFKISFR